jgi:hypothetical protein
MCSKEKLKKLDLKNKLVSLLTPRISEYVEDCFINQNLQSTHFYHISNFLERIDKTKTPDDHLKIADAVINSSVQKLRNLHSMRPSQLLDTVLGELNRRDHRHRSHSSAPMDHAKRLLCHYIEAYPQDAERIFLSYSAGETGARYIYKLSWLCDLLDEYYQYSQAQALKRYTMFCIRKEYPKADKAKADMRNQLRALGSNMAWGQPNTLTRVISELEGGSVHKQKKRLIMILAVVATLMLAGIVYLSESCR